jgi:hypothetical protein
MQGICSSHSQWKAGETKSIGNNNIHCDVVRLVGNYKCGQTASSGTRANVHTIPREGTIYVHAALCQKQNQ